MEHSSHAIVEDLNVSYGMDYDTCRGFEDEGINVFKLQSLI